MQMLCAEIPLTHYGANLYLALSRNAAFVRMHGIPIYETETEYSIGAFFGHDTFKLFTDTKQEDFNYGENYAIDTTPLLKQWLIQQNLGGQHEQ